MIFTNDNKECPSFIKLSITQNGKEYNFDFKEPFRSGKQGLNKEPFDFVLTIDKDEYVGKGSFGQDALWLPYGNGAGLKIIRTENNWPHTLDPDQVVKNINYIKEINSEIFPNIEWVTKADISGQVCVLTEMEDVQDIEMEYPRPAYMPEEDFNYYKDILNVPVQVLKKCISEFINHKLLPETSWYKNGGFGARNILDGKIVDFHLFEHKPSMYSFPVNECSTDECQKIYDDALDRYKRWIPIDGVPKWKGKIYQGMNFDNGFTMPGYSSDDENFDSYVKACFLPLDKVKDKKVLDLGSNQGFFDFQCALAGAETTGIEITKEDVTLAKDIKDKILKLEKSEFIHGDAIKYLHETKDWYEVIIMSSVLHQTHPDLYACDDFLQSLASKCRYFFFETPVGHKHYNFSLKQVTEKLQEHFYDVRMLYFYDCYSTGYRAVYICYPWDPPQNGPGVYEQIRKEGRLKK